MGYKHGAYAGITNSRVQSSSQSATVVAYVGTAPVNLIKGYNEDLVINTPVKITDINTAKSMFGMSAAWSLYTLCEAMTVHFDLQKVGPFYMVNVLNPKIHRKSNETTKNLVVSNGKAEFKSNTITFYTYYDIN